MTLPRLAFSAFVVEEGGKKGEKKENKTSPLPSPILAYNSLAIL